MKYSQNTKKNTKKLKESFKAIFNAHFATLVSKEHFSYNVVLFSGSWHPKRPEMQLTHK